MDMIDYWQSLAHAHGGFIGRALIKQAPEDFVVNEELPWVASGEGEHLWVKVEKRGANTFWVAERLAKQLGIKPDLVSFAGLKDRWSVSRQTFSLPWPIKQALPEWQEDSEFRVLGCARHTRKLRRGALSGNAFKLIFRQPNVALDVLEQRLQQLRQDGFPNYFGLQRFGHDGGNLQLNSRRTSRQARAMQISAVRSFLFNKVLDYRVGNRCWRDPLAGDVMGLSRNSALFAADPCDPEICSRLKAGALSITGPLPGSGSLPSGSEAAELEANILRPFKAELEFLASIRAESARRHLRIIPDDLILEDFSDSRFGLSFRLPAGTYATSLVRELVSTTQPESRLA